MSDERLVSYSIIGKPETLHCTGQEASLFLFAFNLYHPQTYCCVIFNTHTHKHTHTFLQCTYSLPAMIQASFCQQLLLCTGYHTVFVYIS